MRICLLFVLLLNAFALAVTHLDDEKAARRAFIEKLDDAKKKFLADTRDSLLASLQANDVESTFRYVKVLADSASEDYALDKYELLQVYLLMDQFDSAIVTLTRDFANHLTYDKNSGFGTTVSQYSAFYDNLNFFLDEKMNLSKSGNLQIQLERIANANIKQEYKDLASVMKEVQKGEIIKGKSVVCHYDLDSINEKKSKSCPKLDKIYDRRYYESNYGLGFERLIRKDTTSYNVLIKLLGDFFNKYPNSEFNSWVQKQLRLEKENKEAVLRIKYYYNYNLYTGGIGVELFTLLSKLGAEINFVFQYKRLMFLLNYGIDKKNSGWNYAFGVDVFETKSFKVFPFVGFDDPMVAGLQLEYRPWISELGRDLPIGAYCSLKAKYEVRIDDNQVVHRNENGQADSYKTVVNHRFYLGVGFHIW